MTPIAARFTRTLDPGTVTSATFQLRHGSTPVSANSAYDTPTRTVTLTPTSALAPLTDYSVTVLDGPTGVKDSGGAELAGTVVWSFQTGSDAHAVRLAYGFVEGAGTAVDDASGNGNSGTLTNGPAWTTDGKYGRALGFDGVNGRIDDVRLYVRALTPAEIVDDMSTSVEDITGPTVTTTSPMPDALDVATAATVAATFNEPLAAGSVSSSTFELRDALGVLVPAAVSYDAPSRTATLDPSSTLGAASVYTATLKAGMSGPRVTDVAGNVLATGYSWSSSAPSQTDA